MLSKLKISCDYASRGCPEFTCVEGLETHVANCEFAPVFCSNENCGMEINKQDQVHHETEVCGYRKVKCHDCGQTREVVGKLKETLMELDGKVQTAEKKMENNHAEMKKIVGKLEGSLVGMNKRINEKVEAIKNRHDEMKHEQHEEMAAMKENLSKVNKDVDEVKVMMSQMLEKFNMLELLSKLPSPTEGMFNTPREDILIASGWGAKCAEIFSWEKNGWYKISEMNEGHAGASSFIYNDQLFVVGGLDTTTIETLDLNELPLKWMEFSDKLPYASCDHQTVVYQQRVIHIGGYNGDEEKKSNVISELQLTSPCTLKELCQMPQPRQFHGAEALEDKVLILGGEDDNDVLDSVLEFDPEKNECKELPSLPHPMKEMATVRWRDQVVVLGGCDEDDQVLNDVFMYDCKTGKITALPSMLEKRCDCCAVITGNTIVVMGGVNVRQSLSSAVECFTMGGSTWKYLPSMNKERSAAVAELLPSTRKCVYV